MHEDKAEAVMMLRVTFAANLDRLMTLRGMRNVTLAKAVGVSRQMISQWRVGQSVPTPDREEILARSLRCAVNELFDEVTEKTPPMIAITLWAKREGIPLTRAKSLFERGILDGSLGPVDGEILLVPAHLHAPPNAKQLLSTYRRPEWALPFAVNLDRRMRTDQIYNSEMGKHTGVHQSAVTHWRTGRGYPNATRLPIIAAKLGCTVDDLCSIPSEIETNEWYYRYATSVPDTAVAA